VDNPIETPVKAPDVLVIGAGVVGVCSAYYLARSGIRVVVVEKDEVCAGCSWGNAGLLVPSHSIPLPVPGIARKAIKWMFHSNSPLYIRLGFDRDLIAWLWQFQKACNHRAVEMAIPVLRDLSDVSLDLYSQLAGIPDLNFGLQHKGLLALFISTKGYKEGAASARWLRREGIPAVEMCADEVHHAQPAVAPAVVGGIGFPGDAHLTPPDFVVGLSRVATELGARFLTGVEVNGFEKTGNRITLVKTSRGPMRPNHIVLAAGAWSPALAAELRIKLPLQAGKGYSVTFEQPANSPTVPLLLGEAKCAVTPMGEKLRVAGTLEFGSSDNSINPGRVDSLLRAMTRYVQMDVDQCVSKKWAGLRPCTPDGLPIISRADGIENLILATGHGMLGVSLGPVTGKIVSQLISGISPVVDITKLHASRFS
jgi:D-amino-acid dehydrogenase